MLSWIEYLAFSLLDHRVIGRMLRDMVHIFSSTD